ncbi:hypothetical protein [Estrella lausannensis]|nr:hypothetical protein [Estrella lausannensis]
MTLAKLAKEIGKAAESGTLSPQEAKMALDKLSQMKVMKDSYKSGSVLARVKSSVAEHLLPKNVQESKSSTVQMSKATKNLEKAHSGLEAAVPESSRSDYRGMIGKVDMHVDMLFDKAKIPDGQSIMVHVREDNGMGDLMLAVKTVNALKEKFPNLDIQVSLEVRTIKMDDAIAKIRGETKNSGLPAGNVNAFDKRPSDAKEPGMILIMPDNACTEAEHLWSNFQTPPEKLMVKEYGWGGPLASGGLGSASLGIFLDSRLTHISDTQTSGKGVSEMASHQARDLILNGKSPEDYSASNKLYFAYAHMPNPSAGFMKSIIKMNDDDKKDIDFFMRTENHIPGANWNLNVDNQGLHFMDNFGGKGREVDDISFNLLKENGISKVEVIKVKREIQTIEVENPDGTKSKVTRLVPVKNDDGTFKLEGSISHDVPGAPSDGKTLRIIDCFPIPHSDVMKLVEHSEPETLITGNQSFGEAVSASKSFFYEQLPNDISLGQQMSGLAGTIDPQFQQVMEKMQCFEGKMDYESIASALKDPSTRANFREYGAKVQEEFDLGKRLELKVKRGLISHTTPLVKKELEKIEETTSKLSSEEMDARDELRSNGTRVRADTPIPMPSGQFQQTVDSLASPVSKLIGTLDIMH